MAPVTKSKTEIPVRKSYKLEWADVEEEDGDVTSRGTPGTRSQKSSTEPNKFSKPGSKKTERINARRDYLYRVYKVSYNEAWGQAAFEYDAGLLDEVGVLKHVEVAKIEYASLHGMKDKNDKMAIALVKELKQWIRRTEPAPPPPELL